MELKYENIVHLKIKVQNEKMRETDTLDTKGILRLIESVPSSKAEPFKLWLAKLGVSMGIISLASGSSCWRGLDYYKNKNVTEIKKINENEYLSVVKGTKNYNVYLNIKHPKKSTCDCPLANGKNIICKHIIATYFCVMPKEAINFEEEQIRLQEEYEKELENEYNKVIECLNKMSKQELIEELIQIFDYGPEWIYDDFVKRNV